MKGIEMVSQLKEDGHPVSSVLLFTDGAANVGYQCAFSLRASLRPSLVLCSLRAFG